ncbi:MAG: hypothetical protein HXY18_04480 [Bryobacteraceae bacterium]|nr:hypothetical protein [Bryobacteraceae bacterium]
MAHAAALAESFADHRVVARAPEELTAAKLEYLGEGVGKVVYASPHWVVKRERRPREILALIAIWRAVRKLEGYLPRSIARNFLERPAKQIRLLRLVAEALVTLVPLGYWLSSNVGNVRRLYRRRGRLGEFLAARHLAGAGLIAETITFPPVRVRGWPGWLVVEEATERVEQTLGAHLRNFGVPGGRVVLIAPRGRPPRGDEIAGRLDAAWKALLNPGNVRRHWPEAAAGRTRQSPSPGL